MIMYLHFCMPRENQVKLPHLITQSQSSNSDNSTILSWCLKTPGAIDFGVWTQRCQQHCNLCCCIRLLLNLPDHVCLVVSFTYFGVHRLFCTRHWPMSCLCATAISDWRCTSIAILGYQIPLNLLQSIWMESKTNEPLICGQFVPKSAWP